MWYIKYFLNYLKTKLCHLAVWFGLAPHFCRYWSFHQPKVTERDIKRAKKLIKKQRLRNERLGKFDIVFRGKIDEFDIAGFLIFEEDGRWSAVGIKPSLVGQGSNWGMDSAIDSFIASTESYLDYLKETRPDNYQEMFYKEPVEEFVVQMKEKEDRFEKIFGEDALYKSWLPPNTH